MMNEKAGLIGYPPQRVPLHYSQSRPVASSRRVVKVGKWICALLLLVYIMYWRSDHGRSQPADSMAVVVYTPPPTFEGQVKKEWKVPLEAHIMSKCPDALECLELLVVPAMAVTFAKVNFTMSYIGTPTEPDDGVSCRHGPTECLGNIIELCAAKLYPDPKISLGFTLCLTREYEQIPAQSLVQGCALEHGIDFQKLNDCASDDDGAYGMGLLRQSVTHSKAVGADLSCTVRLNETTRCIRDGGEWKDCNSGSSVQSLVDDIERLWHEANGKA